MNSSVRTVLLCVALGVLIAGAIAALTQPGGGQSDRRAEHRAPLSPPAASPIASPPTTSPAPVSREPPAPRRERAGYPDPPLSTVGAPRTVAAFLRGFLAWSYGHAPASAITHATAGFMAQVRSDPPNVTPADRREHTRILGIRIVAGHPTVAIVDLAPIGGVPYELGFYLAHTDGRWQISQLATPGSGPAR